MEIILRPVGFVHSLIAAEVEIKKEDFWGGVHSEIRLNPEQFDAEATRGVADFSHIEVLFYLHDVAESSVITGSRHPRGNPDWPRVGIFAQRAKARPNRIAATICRLLSVDGLVLKVEGLDALDGSPVLDIKPVFREFLPQGALRQPTWSHEMMSKYFADE